MDPNISVNMCSTEAWPGGVARSPSHESVTTDLSLFSVSSTASDARVLRLLACKTGQGADPSLRVSSPNPDSKALKRPSTSLTLNSSDTCRELLAGCAQLCVQLGLRRTFSCSDVGEGNDIAHPLRSATSEVGLCAALEALTLSAASRSCSTWVAVGGSQLPSPQRSHPAQVPHKTPPADNKKVRQNYIKRRLLTTYRALERVSQSDFNLDRLEAAAVSAVANAVSGPGPTTLAVPQAKQPHSRFVQPGQGADPSLRVSSPNPDSKALKRPSTSLTLNSSDTCRELLAGCAQLCVQLGLRRTFSCSDVGEGNDIAHPLRSATSEVGLCAALEALTLSAASRSCSTWVAVGGSQLPSPQRSHPAQVPHKTPPADNKKVRQNYIKRRLLTTYRALERVSQSDFNLDRLEAAAVSAVANAVSGPGPTTLAVPQAKQPHSRFVQPEAAYLALTAADLESERGRPLSKYERNMMIFNWLHTLDEAAPF